MNPKITRSASVDWTPLVETGVKTDGIYVKVLRLDDVTRRAPTFLLKFDAGASYPNHNQPGGEEVFILEGEARFGPNQLSAGDYLYTPPWVDAPGVLQDWVRHVFYSSGGS